MGIVHHTYHKTDTEVPKKRVWPGIPILGGHHVFHATNCIGPPAPLPTELRRFCEMKYLLEKETHDKNEENTLKELNEIFLMVYSLPK